MTRLRSAHHLVLAVTAVVALGAVAACGREDAAPTMTGPPPTEPTPTTEGPGVDIGSDPKSPLLTMDDRLAVALDGTVYRRGDPSGDADGFARRAPVAAPIPATPAPWEMAPLSDDGRARLLAEMDALGFLQAPPDYGDYDVTDSSTFVLTVHVDDQTHVHELYFPEERIGDAEADAARERLTDLIGFLDDIEDELDAEIGDFVPYLPDQWRVTEVRGGAPDAAEWTFREEPEEGCTAFAAEEPTVSGVDHVSGRYRLDGRDLDVSPLLPWERC